jgi:hypothetical protein
MPVWRKIAAALGVLAGLALIDLVGLAAGSPPSMK